MGAGSFPREYLDALFPGSGIKTGNFEQLHLAITQGVCVLQTRQWTREQKDKFTVCLWGNRTPGPYHEAGHGF